MTLTIDLPEELELRIRAAADRAGLDASAYALKMLIETVPNDAPVTQPKSLADMLKGYVGVVRSTPRADGKPWSEIEASSDFD